MRTQTTNRRGGLLLAGVASLALLGGSAFTASNTGMVAEVTQGYGETTVSGAKIVSLSYAHSADMDTITSISLGLEGDTTTSTVEVLLDDNLTDDAVTTVTCSAGAVVSGTPDTTPYTCTPIGGYDTADLVRTAVVVEDGSNVTS